MRRKVMVAAIYAVLLVVIMAINLHIRCFPAYFPQLRKQAEMQVRDSVRQHAADSIASAGIHYNALVRDRLVGQIVKQKEKQEQFAQALRLKHQELKGPFQDAGGGTYLLTYDAFQWLRYTRDILDHGHPGHIIKNGMPWDTLMRAPEGFPVARCHFLFRSTAFLYRAYNLIFPDVSIERFCFFVPVFHTAVLLILVFLFCRRYFTTISGILAMLLVGLAPAFVVRSCAGVYDMDVLNLIFSLGIIWLMAEAPHRKALRATALYALAAGFAQALFAYTWPGWYFAYIIVMIVQLLEIANILSLHWGNKLEMNKRVVPYLLSAVTFLVSSAVLCWIVAGMNPFSFIYTSIIQNIGLGKALHQSIWPSTYYTVMELMPGDFEKLASSVHGVFFFLAAVASMAWLYVRERRTHKANICIALVFWYAFIFYAFSRGARFVYFLTVPSAVFVSVLVDELARCAHVRAKAAKSCALRFAPACAVVIVFLIAAYVSAYKKSYETALGKYPLFNDSWNEELVKLRESTPEDAIVAAWWDYGSWIKEVAARKVLFDGHSQNIPLAYWIGRFFCCGSEAEAIGILRMVAHSSDNLFESMDAHIQAPYKTARLLQQLGACSEDKARAILASTSIPAPLCDTIVAYIHTPPPCSVYVLAAGDMEAIMPSISYIGNWDFAKAFVVQSIAQDAASVKQTLVSTFALSPENASRLYAETAPASGAKEQSEVLSKRESFGAALAGRQDGSLIVFQMGLIYNRTTGEAKVLGAGNSFKYAQFIYFSDGKGCTFIDHRHPVSEEKSASGRDMRDSGDACPRAFLGHGYLIVPGEQDGTWRAIALSSPELGQSMLVQLLLLRGTTLTHFTLESHNEKGQVLVFKANLGARDREDDSTFGDQR